MTDERYKKIMADLGMPNSQSLLSALKQVANEVAQECYKQNDTFSTSQLSEEAEIAVRDIVRDAQVFGLAGSTNLPGVRCEVKGLTLGHWQRLWAALGN